jgi:hypothetical protein
MYSIELTNGGIKSMGIFVLFALMIGSCIWWYTDLYDIINNLSDKLLVKNRLITMCIATIVNLFLLLLIFFYILAMR